MTTAPRALVVDDSKTMRLVLTRQLTELGFTVTQAGDGVEALAAFDAATTGGEPFTLILTDWSMPVMDGLALVKALRRRRSGAAVAVVMVSSENDQAHIARALLAGVDEYVMKPVTRDNLASALELLGVHAP